jgi:hypothetical protein
MSATKEPRFNEKRKYNPHLFPLDQMEEWIAVRVRTIPKESVVPGQRARVCVRLLVRRTFLALGLTVSVRQYCRPRSADELCRHALMQELPATAGADCEKVLVGHGQERCDELTAGRRYPPSKSYSLVRVGANFKVEMNFRVHPQCAFTSLFVDGPLNRPDGLFSGLLLRVRVHHPYQRYARLPREYVQHVHVLRPPTDDAQRFWRESERLHALLAINDQRRGRRLRASLIASRRRFESTLRRARESLGLARLREPAAIVNSRKAHFWLLGSDQGSFLPASYMRTLLASSSQRDFGTASAFAGGRLTLCVTPLAVAKVGRINVRLRRASGKSNADLQWSIGRALVASDERVSLKELFRRQPPPIAWCEPLLLPAQMPVGPYVMRITGAELFERYLHIDIFSPRNAVSRARIEHANFQREFAAARRQQRAMIQEALRDEDEDEFDEEAAAPQRAQWHRASLRLLTWRCVIDNGLDFSALPEIIVDNLLFDMTQFVASF